MSTSTNTQIMSRKELLRKVCDRLEILTVGQCHEIIYSQHMEMALESLKEEGVVINSKEYKSLKSYIERMRHDDFFDILHKILFEEKTVQEAVNEVIEMYKEDGDYVNSEFYDFMFAIDKESEYNELWSEWNSSLIHSSHEIGGGKVGYVSIMNEMRDDDGKLIDSWVEEIPENGINCCDSCNNDLGTSTSYVTRVRDEVFGTWNERELCQGCYHATIEKSLNIN